MKKQQTYDLKKVLDENEISIIAEIENQIAQIQHLYDKMFEGITNDNMFKQGSNFDAKASYFYHKLQVLKAQADFIREFSANYNHGNFEDGFLGKKELITF